MDLAFCTGASSGSSRKGRNKLLPQQELQGDLQENKKRQTLVLGAHKPKRLGTTVINNT